MPAVLYTPSGAPAVAEMMSFLPLSPLAPSPCAKPGVKTSSYQCFNMAGALNQ